MITTRGRLALAAGSAARWASRATGRGAGAMIGGLVSMTLDKSILAQLGQGRRSVVVTGTNGKSTTTRMTAAALQSIGPVATNAEGANMDAGLIAALSAARDAGLAALEVDEMHVPHVADAVEPGVIVLLNLSRDQLDRVGEINHIERTLRGGLARHPDAVIVANCDDVLMTSAAYDSPNVVWVAAGGSWANDSVSCPRSGEPIVRNGEHWSSTGTEFSRPTPDWHIDDEFLYGPDDLKLPMALSLPGRANRGNAAQAVAAAVSLGVDPSKAVAAVASVREIAGRYNTIQVGPHAVRMLLAKNPAGWQEALSMVDTTIGYPPAADAPAGTPPTVIVRGINRSVMAGQRIGILGANGQGKSTLVKTIAGDLQAIAGEVTTGKGLTIGYFAQQELDVLRPQDTPLEHMIRLAKEAIAAGRSNVPGREQELRNFLGTFNFGGDMVKQPVGTMSGGEKARLVRCMIVWQRPNLLLLDEPTNHLDLATREALGVALNEFEGTVMLVSHDRALLRAVCDEFWLVSRGGVGPFDGDLDDYQQYLLDEAKRVREEAALA